MTKTVKSPKRHPSRFKGRVLLVNEKRSAMSSYARWLGEAGFEVAAAVGPAEALERVKREAFDVILSNLPTPKTRALTFLRDVREQSPTNVVLLLGKPDNRIATEATELGAVYWLVKPIDPESLKKSIAYAVDFRRKSKQEASHLLKLHVPSVSATEAKNEFGRILETAIRDGLVFIKKHESTKAVVMSIERFDALSTAAKLDSLTEEFDALLASMQTEKARSGMKAAFGASPRHLGSAL